MKSAMTALVKVLSFAMAVLIGAPAAVLAKDPVNTDLSGAAVKGYDPAAYFTEGEPVKGSPEFEYRWQGAKWRFSSEKHLELFKATPEKYAPQYGGY
ncbi:MAG: YHS domain-containing protein [Desulfobacterales bacterium]|nr:MAG: YHS domain-containing protein [Desulfobacterales bacterium]